MLKKLHNIRIDLLVLILSLKVFQVRPSPVCHSLKDENTLAMEDLVKGFEGSCRIIREREDCLLSFVIASLDVEVKDVKFLEHDSGDFALVDASVYYNWGPHTNRFLLQDKSSGACWSVHLDGGYHRSTKRTEVFISNLPVSLDFSGLLAAAVFVDPHEHSCNASKKICGALYNSSLFFSSTNSGESVTLKIDSDEDAEYKVDLLSGDCNITCEGITNPCSVFTRNDTLKIDSKNRRNEIAFFNLTPGFYCARIGVDNCCFIHTETDELKKVTEISIVVVRDPMPVYAFPAIIVLLIIASLFLFYLTKSRLFNIVRRLNPSVRQPGEDCNTSLVPETEIRELIAEMKNSVKVYLLYYNESEQFLELMNLFRQMLTPFVKKVWDPFSEDDIEDVSKNIAAWIQDVMKDHDMRIIIVETEKSIQAERNWIQCRPNPNDNHHFLNCVFINSLSMLNHDPHLSHDYSRTFIIRIKPTLNESLNILNCARYQMTDHFENLIYDISRHLAQVKNIEIEDFSRLIFWSNEKDEFTRAQNKYNSIIV